MWAVCSAGVLKSTHHHEGRSIISAIMPDPSLEPDSRPVVVPGRWYLLVALTSVLFVMLSLHAASLETPTVDEFAHVTAGCAYLKYGTLELFAKNPPLVKMHMAAAVLLSRDVSVPDPERISGDQAWGPWIYGFQFMEANRDQFLALFFPARLMVILYGLGTGLLLFCWTRQVFDVRSAAISTALFLLTPLVLAHSHLGTTDVACMFSIFLTTFLLRVAMRKVSYLWVAAVGLAWGAALLVKFTAVLLLPVILLSVLYARWNSKSRGLLEIVAIIVIATLTINLGMGFQGSFQPLGDFDLKSSFGSGLQDGLPEWFPVPVPRAYLIGFDAVKLDTEEGEFGSYLFGTWSRSGRWYYDLVAFVVKSPLPLVVLLACAPWFLYRFRMQRDELLQVLVPLLVLVILMMGFNRVQIGIRYQLPILPFLYLLVTHVWHQLPDRASRWMSRLVLAWYIVSIVLTHPSYLSHFSCAVGGEAQGHRYLADSNLDWGQDLYRLKPALEELNHEGKIGLLYYGHVDPQLYNIVYQLVPAEPVEGLIAVSVNYLMGAAYLATSPDRQPVQIHRGHLRWLRKHRPIRRLGSIWIFDTRHKQEAQH